MWISDVQREVIPRLGSAPKSTLNGYQEQLQGCDSYLCSLRLLHFPQEELAARLQQAEVSFLSHNACANY